jgi:ABC-2 type transport system permease protein
MNGAILTETLKRNWRQMLYWGIGLGMLGMYTVLVIPNVDTLKQYSQLIESMPPVLMQAFGANDLSVFASAEGFIAFGFLTYGLLLLLVYGVLAGLNITANEEDDGILDMMLALPVGRTQIMVEKFGAYTLLTIGIVTISFMGLALGAVFGSLEFDFIKLLPGALSITLGILLVMALTAFVAVVVRRKSTAIGISVTFIIVSYFINFIGNAASQSAAGAVRALSFFRYADAQNVVAEGLNIGGVLVLAVVTLALFAGSIWAFDRRDVGL